MHAICYNKPAKKATNQFKELKMANKTEKEKHCKEGKRKRKFQP